MANYLPAAWPAMQTAIATVVRRGLPVVAQVVRVDILAPAVDGAYVVTINGQAATFVAASSSVAQIRDGIIAAVLALVGAGDVTTPAVVDGDSLNLMARDAGLAFTVVPTGPATGTIAVVTTTANFAWTCAWAFQDAPAPAFPYASLRVLSPPKAIGHAEVRHASSSPTVLAKTIEHDADLTLEVQLHARLANADNRPVSEIADCGMVVSGLEIYFADPDALAVLRASGLAVRDALSVRDLTGLGGSRHESRVALDMRLGARVRRQTASVDWFADPAIATTVINGDHFVGTIGA